MTPASRRFVPAAGALRLAAWEFAGTSAGAFGHPAQADAGITAWQSAASNTIAGMLRDVGAWCLDSPARRFDAEDWWLRTRFDLTPEQRREAPRLRFEGLAGLAEVWLNGEPLLSARNMHLAHACEIASLAREGGNVLHVRIAALDAALAERRPRPRWRAPMVEHQQLRWHRQALLGRTPGWSPPAPPLGLWRDAWLEWRGPLQVDLLDLRTSVLDSTCGQVDIRCAITCRPDAAPARVELELGLGDRRLALELAPALGTDADNDAAARVYAGTLRVPEPVRWWPHTHGDPVLYHARLCIYDPSRAAPVFWTLPHLGFREIALNTEDGAFALSVNGVPVFCRGASWMPLDGVSLRAEPTAVRAAVQQVRDTGMNMLRVAGTTVYEDAAFFEACDALGVLVWQDFMFANMDYPAEDAAFLATVQAEAMQHLARWQPHACVAVVCGNSEVEQQAALWGAPRDAWRNPLFDAVLREAVRAFRPDVPYWPSSAHGGAWPHQADAGTTSYYGVGAYLRPLDDARRADLRFATECLAFANVPEPVTIARMPGGLALRVHQPAWRARAPRDLGAGWDFEDVRDHYLGLRYGVDVLRTRSADHDRYLALSRSITGEVMSASFAEWRRAGSRCGGALVWFLRDLWAGAGWGLLDDEGEPKACWHHLRRVLQPLAVLLTDEGGNGLAAHLVNERATAFEGALHVTLHGPAGAVVGQARAALSLPAHTTQRLGLASLFDGFVDLAYAYRFGPPPVLAVHAQLSDADGTAIHEAVHFPVGVAALQGCDPTLTVDAEPVLDGTFALGLRTDRIAHGVNLLMDGVRWSDNHFDLLPGASKRVIGRIDPRVRTGSGWVRALNASEAVAIRLPE